MKIRKVVVGRNKKSFAGYVDYMNNSPEALTILLRMGMIGPFIIGSIVCLLLLWNRNWLGGLVLWGVCWIFWFNMKKNIALFRSNFDSNIQQFVYGRKELKIRGFKR